MLCTGLSKMALSDVKLAFNSCQQMNIIHRLAQYKAGFSLTPHRSLSDVIRSRVV